MRKEEEDAGYGNYQSRNKYVGAARDVHENEILSMEMMGEQTRNTLLAFTALRLEMNWKAQPINSKHLEKLRYLKDKYNPIEEAVQTLLN